MRIAELVVEVIDVDGLEIKTMVFYLEIWLLGG